jgi:hypothetical protein
MSEETEEVESTLEEVSNIPEPRFGPEEDDFDTKVGRWQCADTLRRLIKTASSDIYYFERNNTPVMGYHLERRDKDEDGKHVTQFRALPVDEEN